MREWLSTVVEWVPRIVRERCRLEQDWMLTRRQRWWHTVKAVLVVVLWRNGYQGERAYPDQIEAGHGPTHRWYSYEWGECGSCEYLVVGRGVLHGWWFDFGEASWP